MFVSEAVSAAVREQMNERAFSFGSQVPLRSRKHVPPYVQRVQVRFSRWSKNTHAPATLARIRFGYLTRRSALSLVSTSILHTEPDAVH